MGGEQRAAPASRVKGRLYFAFCGTNSCNKTRMRWNFGKLMYCVCVLPHVAHELAPVSSGPKTPDGAS
jgi:hypothetical protein